MRGKSLSLRFIVLAPQPASLIHSEAVLLVYNGKPQGVELHPVLNESMCAYDYVQSSFFKIAENLFPVLSLGASRKEGDRNRSGFEEF